MRLGVVASTLLLLVSLSLAQNNPGTINGKISDPDGGVVQGVIVQAKNASPDPTWMGHSTGKWEGDTLVIDSVGFNDKSWLPNFLPHTEKLHIVERYRRVDFGHLNIDMTFDDPGTLSKPWHMHVVWELAPNEEILEYICTENNRFRENAGPKESR